MRLLLQFVSEVVSTNRIGQLRPSLSFSHSTHETPCRFLKKFQPTKGRGRATCNPQPQGGKNAHAPAQSPATRLRGSVGGGHARARAATECASVAWSAGCCARPCTPPAAPRCFSVRLVTLRRTLRGRRSFKAGSQSDQAPLFKFVIHTGGTICVLTVNDECQSAC